MTGHQQFNFGWGLVTYFGGAGLVIYGVYQFDPRAALILFGLLVFASGVKALNGVGRNL